MIHLQYMVNVINSPKMCSTKNVKVYINDTAINNR